MFSSSANVPASLDPFGDLEIGPQYVEFTEHVAVPFDLATQVVSFGHIADSVSVVDSDIKIGHSLLIALSFKIAVYAIAGRFQLLVVLMTTLRFRWSASTIGNMYPIVEKFGSEPGLLYFHAIRLYEREVDLFPERIMFRSTPGEENMGELFVRVLTRSGTEAVKRTRRSIRLVEQLWTILLKQAVPPVDSTAILLSAIAKPQKETFTEVVQREKNEIVNREHRSERG